MKKQVKCPNCESFKTRRAINDKGIESVIGKLVVMGGCLSIIPFLLFPPLLLLSIVIMALGGGIANIRMLLRGEELFECRGCGIKFTVAKG